MKINLKPVVDTQITTQKKEIKTENAEPKDGFTPGQQVSGEEAIPRNLVSQAVEQSNTPVLKPNEELHKPTVMEVAGETAGTVGNIIGGGVGLIGIGAGLYAGGVGGLMTGGAIGLGFGPVNAVLTGKVGFDIVKTVFSTGGAMAKAGIVIGSAAAAVGAGVLGYKLGKVAGMIPGYIIGVPVGIASSKEEVIVEKQEPKKKKDISKLAKGIAGVTGGATGLAGLSGGALIGAGIGTAGATVSGLLLKDLSWAALGQGGMWGAIIGGGAMAVAAGYGGYKIVEWAARGIDKAKDTASDVKDVAVDVAEKPGVKDMGKKVVDGAKEVTYNLAAAFLGEKKRY